MFNVTAGRPRKFKSPHFGFRRLSRLPFTLLGDEPRAVVVSKVSPGPLRHHKETIAEADQEEQVDEEPGQPSEVAGEMQLAEVGDSV